MNEPPKPIPRFDSEAQERAFWESHDSTDYLDWSQARRAGALADWDKYTRQQDAARLPGATDVTEADITQAIADVRAC